MLIPAYLYQFSLFSELFNNTAQPYINQWNINMHSYLLKSRVTNRFKTHMVTSHGQNTLGFLKG